MVNGSGPPNRNANRGLQSQDCQSPYVFAGAMGNDIVSNFCFKAQFCKCNG